MVAILKDIGYGLVNSTGVVKMKKLLSGICVLSFALCSNAYAIDAVATLSGVSGKVLVNQGQGFVAVLGSQNLQAGDQVLVGDESHVTVTYMAAACSVDVSQPRVMAIGKTAPCTKGEVVALSEATFIAPANGHVAGGVLGGLNSTTLAIGGGLTLAAIVGGGYLLVKDKNKKNPCSNSVSACP
jgi:predicted RecA/RadA family phage recombinase